MALLARWHKWGKHWLPHTGTRTLLRRGRILHRSHISWRLPGGFFFYSQGLLHLLLCVRESLSNAARHAHASAVEVHVRATPERLHLTVLDDGIGFHAVPGQPSSGLDNK